MFNVIEHPACLRRPERITTLSAWTHHLPVAMALVETHQPRLLVELGTHLGDSYCAFCQAVTALSLPTRCYAVDTWLGDEHSGKYGDEVYQQLCDYHDPRYGGFSQLLRMEFDAARPLFESGSVDLLHIDGFHTYEAVRHDFDTWRETLSDRAIVLFHDILVRENGFGVWRLWEELRAEYEHFEFAHVHGLGVLLIGQQQPAALRQLAESVGREQATADLFDALGCRATLEQTRMRQQEKLSQFELQTQQQEEQLGRLGEQVALQQQELEQRRAIDQERQQHLDHWVAQARQLAQEVEQLNAELQRYQQAHYRLLDQFNRLLRKVGPLHRATKAAAEWSVSQAERWRSTPQHHHGVRPPAALANNPRD